MLAVASLIPTGYGLEMNTSMTDRAEFGRRLRAAREAKQMTQDELARDVGVTRSVIANYERGETVPDPTRALELAHVLSAKKEDFLLLSVASSVAARPANDLAAAPRQAAIETLERLHRAAHGVEPRQPVNADYLTLADFPDRFLPLTVIVGDKREDDPKNPGDLFVFSASTVDDRWLMDLGLPRGTEKLSDKVLMTASEQWLEERLGRTHLLVIGSPASNLLARNYNDHFLFRFALNNETVVKWERKRKDLLGRETPFELLAFKENSKSELKHMMRLFKQPGFVNFNYDNLKVGIDLAENRDFAVVSIGRNPFAEPESGFFAILAAGIHHPGTAHAVKRLGQPETFKEHPLGGVLEVQVPKDDLRERDVKWHDRIGMSYANWHRIGDKSLEYTPGTLLSKLQDWELKLRRREIITDIVLTEHELQQHMRLIRCLESKPSSAST